MAVLCNGETDIGLSKISSDDGCCGEAAVVVGHQSRHWYVEDEGMVPALNRSSTKYLSYGNDDCSSSVENNAVLLNRTFCHFVRPADLCFAWLCLCYDGTFVLENSKASLPRISIKSTNSLSLTISYKRRSYILYQIWYYSFDAMVHEQARKYWLKNDS
ncbi:hypothetical protein NPIL_531561 [Nephila pilipes]|uniref:Uncharacterized protein n=1 Tax=Nephila pilipes TaxID=299642 RepID=A0A8X6PM86_NEPPI|nr:hypothetical protein NPIL_531561 [Nephila pilipes]